MSCIADANDFPNYNPIEQKSKLLKEKVKIENWITSTCNRIYFTPFLEKASEEVIVGAFDELKKNNRKLKEVNTVLNWLNKYMMESENVRN